MAIDSLTTLRKQGWARDHFEKVLTDRVQVLSQEASAELQECLLGGAKKRKTEDPKKINPNKVRRTSKLPESPQKSPSLQDDDEEEEEEQEGRRDKGKDAKAGEEDSGSEKSADGDESDDDLFKDGFSQTPAKPSGPGLLGQLPAKYTEMAASFEPALMKTFPADFSRSDLICFLKTLHKEEIVNLDTAMDVCGVEGDLAEHLGESRPHYDRLSLRGKRMVTAWQKKILAMQACSCKPVCSSTLVLQGFVLRKSGRPLRSSRSLGKRLLRPRRFCGLEIELRCCSDHPTSGPWRRQQYMLLRILDMMSLCWGAGKKQTLLESAMCNQLEDFACFGR
ncbi:unnamed protein product [Symbiodinium sp. CCMP2592]|nr:unnamed protein product [Symbiodinium sp. CCMP2592]